MSSTTSSGPVTRVRAHRVMLSRAARLVSVAAERGAGYHVGDPGEGAGTSTSGTRSGPSASGAAGEGAPFGLAVLDEVPALAGALERVVAADRAMLDAVVAVADLLDTDQVEPATGVGIDHWLATIGAQTRMDRRLLVRTARLLHRLPTLHDAVRTGRISFAQLRGLAMALRGCPSELDDQLDPVLAALLDGLDRWERPDPDVLVRQFTDAIDELRADERAAREDDAAAGRFLWLQPFLDGTGGTFSGQLDVAGLALLDAATTPPDQLLASGHGAARADTLLARLAGCAGDCTSSDGPAPASTTAPDHGGPAEGRPWWDRLAPPKLLVRLPFATLLEADVPADLLTGMLGGRVRLTADAARQLLDTRGAELRTLVIDDDGAVIGVGRSTRRPPGWLDDAIAAVHDTCTAPGCDRPARTAQRDHATPWWPTRPDQPAGTTDIDNLGPLCATTNRDKEAAGWQVTQTAGGIRTWHHPRTGLTTTTIPTTWRPPDDPRRRRPPPRPTPPGPTHGPGPHRPAPPGPPPGRDADGPDALPF